MQTKCYNSCMNRGVCRPPGICECEAPWRGYDCGSSRDNGFLYIYSPPDSAGLLAMRKGEHQQKDAAYSSELRFFERLMADFSVRTLKREQARLFYVPTWLTSHYSNTVFEKGVSHYHHLVAALSASRDEAFFNRTWHAHRSRHVFFLSGDKGSCLWPRGPIYISHWGLTTPWKAQVLPHLWRADKLVSVKASEPPCADSRDVIVPPCCHAPKDDASRMPSLGGGGSSGSGSGSGDWRCELLFAGAARAEQKAARSSW